jgi:hypothetical protein
MKAAPAVGLAKDTQLRNRWFYEMDEDAYHRDDSAVNSSSLKLIGKSPASFLAAYSSKEDDDQDSTAVQKIGRKIHKAVLEGEDFLSKMVIMPVFSGKGMKERKANWLDEHADRIIVSEKEYEIISGIQRSVIKHPDAKAILKACYAEVTGYYNDPETGIRCRIRPDLINPNLGLLADLKTTKDCTIDTFARDVWNYRYDIQMAMYSMGAGVISGIPISQRCIIAVEKTPPFECAVYVPEKEVMDKGFEDYRNYMHTLARCMEKNEWPGYQGRAQNINLPPWAFKS